MNLYEKFQIDAVLDEGMIRRSKLSKLAEDLLYIHSLDLDKTEKQLKLEKLKILLFLVLSDIMEDLGNPHNSELWDNYDKLTISIKTLEEEILN